MLDHARPIVLGSFLALFLAACGQTSRTDGTDSALSAALASGTDAAGTLLCSPSVDQVAACTGVTAGGACTLTSPDGSRTLDGTCRTTIDGATVACAPNPPAPPQELVAACTGRASGDACTVTEAFGITRSGACVTARDGATLVCGRVHAPPQVAVDACATLAAGDACTVPGRFGMATMNGTCALGPAASGVLACVPRKDLVPNGVEACTGLSAGDTCSLGRRHERLGGTCTVPADGSAAVCVVSCADVGGRFACGPGGRGGRH